MGRSRKLSTDVSTDERFAELAAASPDFLAPSLYLLAIPHADDWGRLPGEPVPFRLLVCPGFDVSLEALDRALDLIADAGLWCRYRRDDGRRFIAFPFGSWYRYQSYINKDKRLDDAGSSFPAPPDWPGEQQGAENGKQRRSRTGTGKKQPESAEERQALAIPEGVLADPGSSRAEKSKKRRGKASDQQGTAGISASPSPSPSPSPSEEEPEAIASGAEARREREPADREKPSRSRRQREVGRVFELYDDAGVTRPTGGLVARWLATLGELAPLLALLNDLRRRGTLANGRDYVTKAVNNRAGRGVARGPDATNLGADVGRQAALRAIS